MTAYAVVREETRAGAILRRGDLDERDRAICAAVWGHWKEHGFGISVRRLMKACSLASGSLTWRVKGVRPYAGRNGRLVTRRRGGSLLGNGWLIAGAQAAIRPGPRFAALERSHGVAYPLEWCS